MSSHRYIPALSSQAAPLCAMFRSAGHVHLTISQDKGSATARPMTPQEAIEVGSNLIALGMEVLNPTLDVYRCDWCDCDTPHDLRTCIICYEDCCYPEDGERCPHCAEKAHVAAEDRADALREDAAMEVKP